MTFLWSVVCVTRVLFSSQNFVCYTQSLLLNTLSVCLFISTKIHYKKSYIMSTTDVLIMPSRKVDDGCVIGLTDFTNH